MRTASGARSRTCSSVSHRSASTTIASGSSTDTASISASSVWAAATTSNPLVPSRASMLPTRPAVITRSRSLGGREPAGACAEAERWRIDVSVGSRWIVVDDLLYETLEYHHTRRWSCRTLVLRSPTRRGATRPTPVRTIDARFNVARRTVGVAACPPTSDLVQAHGSWSSGQCWSGCYVSPTADSARVTADHRPSPRATTIGPSANAYGPTAYRLQRRRSVPFGGRTESPERGLLPRR